MKKLLIIGIVSLFCSCTSVRYIQPELPEWKVKMPDRPTLVKDDDRKNVLKLINYSKELEVYITTFNEFYKELNNAH